MSVALVSSMSSWSLVTQTFGDGLSEVSIGVEGSSNEIGFEKAHCIQFTCKRKSEAIDKSIQEIYTAATSNQIHEIHLKETPPNCHIDTPNNCKNYRDDLYECGCFVYFRQSHPELRQEFEDRIVQTFKQIIAQGNKDVNIVMFASGGLHAEMNVMYKLLDKIRNVFQGTIHLFLIDKDYKEHAGIIPESGKSVKKICRNQSVPWQDLLGRQRFLQQFLTEISLILSKGIEFTGTVFGSHSDYLERVKEFSAYNDLRHDLLIGADIDNTAKEMQNLQTASRSKLDGIALIRWQQQPFICPVSEKGITLPTCEKLPIKNSAASTTASSEYTTAEIAKEKDSHPKPTQSAVVASAASSAAVAVSTPVMSNSHYPAKPAPQTAKKMLQGANSQSASATAIQIAQITARSGLRPQTAAMNTESQIKPKSFFPPVSLITTNSSTKTRKTRGNRNHSQQMPYSFSKPKLVNGNVSPEHSFTFQQKSKTLRKKKKKNHDSQSSCVVS